MDSSELSLIVVGVDDAKMEAALDSFTKKVFFHNLFSQKKQNYELIVSHFAMS